MVYYCVLGNLVNLGSLGRVAPNFLNLLKFLNFLKFSSLILAANIQQLNAFVKGLIKYFYFVELGT